MPVDVSVEHLKQRRTKIVATVGPASSPPEVLAGLVGAGVDVFRLNMSHGDHTGHREAFDGIRTAAAAAGRTVAVLADLCGPKIRAGHFRGGSVELRDGEEVTVTTRDVEGGPGLIPSRYAALTDDVRAGDRVLLDDGNLELRVESVNGAEARCRVIHGGILKDGKGINLPGVEVSAPSLTVKDREDARFALDLGVDFLALSFVRRPADAKELRELVETGGWGDVQIIAKIEKPEALERIEGILDASDGIMVARGDLGVELPPEAVPLAQMQLVDLARRAGKPAIVATQMLESMISNPRPTRAEVSDVAGAVRSGADAVMLSGETAVGEYPIRAVEMMDRVARDTEGHAWKSGAFGSMEGSPSTTRPMELEEAVSRAAAQLSRDLMVRALVVVTRSGWTARAVSARRPQAPVLGVTHDPSTARRMCLLWGVLPLLVEEDQLHGGASLARRLALDSDLAEKGHFILRVSGFHSDPSRNVPTVSALRV